MNCGIAHILASYWFVFHFSRNIFVVCDLDVVCQGIDDILTGAMPVLSLKQC